MAVGTLYPPISDTTQPAFVNTQKCKVYFIINSLNEVGQYNPNLVQVKVTDNRTGKNVLREDLYPKDLGIKLTSLQQENNKYFISITANDLNLTSFPIDNYYKVQIRFTSSDIVLSISEDSTIEQEQNKIAANSDWFNKNKEDFSAWSSACLIRAIDQPKIEINDLEPGAEKDIATENFSFVGTLGFDDKNELDSLASYRIRLYDENDNLLNDSKILTPESKNTFNYNIKRTLKDGEKFIIKLNYTTSYGYEEELNYPIRVVLKIEQVSGLNNSSFSAQAIPELGAIRLSMILKSNNSSLYNVSKIKILRAELKDNYTIWTLIYEINKPFSLSQEFLYQWDDIITESSEGYKYKIQVFNENDQRYELTKNNDIEIETEKPVLLILEDMFLVSDGLSLRIRYNPSISNFKRTLSESIVNTIGSKYPFVRRNGHMNYKSFSIGGLLSCNTESELRDTLGALSDIDSQDSKVDVDTLVDERYLNSLFMQNIADYKKNFEGLSKADIEIIYEKIFRDKVMDFLYDNSVKLFKSATEGNILIKLTNISFTPNQQLGRRIYSFTAQATEIDDATYENYKKYNIFESENSKIYPVLNVLSAPYEGPYPDTDVVQDNTSSAEISYTETGTSGLEENTVDIIYFTEERGE